MRLNITAEAPFQILANSMVISPSNEGYTIYFSADGEEYTSLKTVAAGINYTLNNIAVGTFFKLMGNASEVEIAYGRDCEGGGSAAGVSSLNGETGDVNIKTINSQSLMGEGNIEIEGGTAYTGGTNIDITDHIISVTGITVPTKVSELENDKGYLTEHQSLDDYAKKDEIPTKTSELTNDSGYISGITSGDVINALDYVPVKSEDVPTKTSELTNDSGYITGITKTDVTTALEYTPAKDTDVPTKTSDLTNDSGYITGITASDVTTALGYTPSKVWTGTEAEYEAITEKDNNTVYLITD